MNTFNNHEGQRLRFYQYVVRPVKANETHPNLPSHVNLKPSACKYKYWENNYFNYFATNSF